MVLLSHTGEGRAGEQIVFFSSVDDHTTTTTITTTMGGGVDIWSVGISGHGDRP
jgi:hypothetical protein